jgi:peroxiredoxin
LPIKAVSAISGERLPPLLKAAQSEVNILQDWWIGGNLPAETFHFEPPPGAVKVARNELVPPPPLNSMVGKMAPDATLELLDGGRFSLSDHVDKHMVVLAFCDPEYPGCSEHLPKVAALARDFQREDVRFQVVIPAESRQAMQDSLAKTPLDIPVAMDPKGRVAKQYLVVPPIAATVLIDKQGKVQVVQMGVDVYPKALEQLRQQIRDVLDGKDLAAEAIDREQKKPSPQTQQVGTGRQEKQPAPMQGARRLWSTVGWFHDVAASPRTGEVYALANGPKLVVLDRRGRQRREISLDGNPDRLRLGNLLAHEQPQIVLFRQNEPGVTAVDAAGKVLWRHDSGHGVNDIQLADLNGNGVDEVIIGSGGQPGLEVLDSAGQVLWTLPDPVWEFAVGDLDGGGQPKIVTGRMGLRVLDARGKFLRNIKWMPAVEMIRLLAAGQQHPELILTAGLAGKKFTPVLAAISLDGQQKWAVDLPGVLASSAAVAPNREWVALGLMEPDAMVVVVDLATGQIVSRIPDQGTRVAVMTSTEGDPILLVASVTGLDAFSVLPAAEAGTKD